LVEFFALLGQDSECEVGAVEITADCKTLCIAVGCEFRKCELRGRRKHPVASCEDKKSASKSRTHLGGVQFLWLQLQDENSSDWRLD
jgi:hypothetical protein